MRICMLHNTITYKLIYPYSYTLTHTYTYTYIHLYTYIQIGDEDTQQLTNQLSKKALEKAKKSLKALINTPLDDTNKKLSSLLYANNTSNSNSNSSGKNSNKNKNSIQYRMPINASQKRRGLVVFAK